MEIKKCSNVSKDLLHQLFLKGYKDYIVDVSMNYDTFYNKFIDYLEIDLDQSFVAIIDDEPVGFILGSINNYENIKTLRCGAFAVIRELRNQSVGSKLFERHLKSGIETNCDRAFLEVIKENKAKSFYLKEGYQIVDELFYYTLDLKYKKFKREVTVNSNPITNNQINDYLIKNKVHINYQNHPVILKNSDTNMYCELISENEKIGIISFNNSGTIAILHLKSSYRKVVHLNSILSYLKSKNSFGKFQISVTSEMHYISLFKAIGFNKEPIEQFEMIKYF